MSDGDPLFALLEVMLRTFAPPMVKPGGHGEEIFVDLTEEEKEEFECSICYQVLKDTRQCMNKHKFCYSCIYVWSNSGSPTNHGRCPVCRTEGLYVHDLEMDEKIGRKRVTCALKSCKWTGPLKLLGSHQHLTYPVGRRIQTTPRGGEEESGSDLPTLRSRSRMDPSPVSASTPNPVLTPRARASDTAETANDSSAAANGAVISPAPATPRSTSTSTHNRSRGTGRNRHSSSVSPTRRHNVTATGLTYRLTNRARIQNNGETVPARIPRPPPGPRPSGRTPRRIPTLPSIVHSDDAGGQTNSGTSNSTEGNTSSDNNNNSNVTNNNSNNNNSNNNNSNNGNSHHGHIINRAIADPSPVLSDVPFTMPERRRYNVETAQARRMSNPRQGFTLIRDRLNESRQRLDALMGAFTVELDRGRQDLTDFQEERERRRQEQLEEVRELGRRLGHVATELRGLLTQRRQIRDQIERLVNEDSD